METRYIVLACALGGAFLAGTVGALFGGLTAHLIRRDGRAAGSIVGRTVAEIFARGDETSLSATAKAIVVGAVDGAFFLAWIGAGIGVWIGLSGHTQPRFMITIAGAVIALPLLAAAFGLMAYWLSSAGVRVLGVVSAASIAGALIGYQLGRADGILIGVAFGAGAGTLLSMRLRR